MKKKLFVIAMFVFAVLSAGTTYLLGFGPSLDDTSLAPLSKHDVGGDGVDFQFLGNTNILLSDGDTSILIDGFFTRPGSLKIAFGEIAPDMQAIDSALSRARIDELDAVITVHSHFDHAMDAPEVARRTGAVLLGSLSTANIGLGWGLDEEQISIAEFGSQHEFGNFRVTMLESKHFVFPDIELGDETVIRKPLVPPVGALEYLEGGAYSVLIEHPRGGRWLIQGSAGFIPHALDEVDVDVLLLGIGGLGGQTADYQRDYWQHVVLATTPELVVPIHFDAITDYDLGDEMALPNNLWARVLGFAPLESIDVVNALAADSCLQIAFPKLWQTVRLSGELLPAASECGGR